MWYPRQAPRLTAYCWPVPETEERPPPAPRVIAALWIAALAFVTGAVLEAALKWDISISVSNYAVTHPASDAFCEYARHNSVGNPWLIVGASLVLLIGGIACLALVITRRSRGRPMRGWAISAGVIEIVLSLVVFGYTALALDASVLACGLG